MDVLMERKSNSICQRARYDFEQITLADFLGAHQRCHQRPATDAHFAHPEHLGHAGISICAHPTRALKPGPTHNVIFHTQPLTAPEIRVPTLMLPDDHVNTQLHQQRNQEIARVVAVCNHDIAALEPLCELP